MLGRLLADVPVTPSDSRGRGVGGLLMEIASRPQPRERRSEKPVPAGESRSTRGGEVAPRVDAVILAAGRSSRMGGPHKLLATFDGVPLIRLSVLTALASQARRVRVVVGHRSAEIKRALAGLDVDITDNPAFAEGLSTSVVAGCGSVFDAGADGALVILADQPRLGSGDLDRLIAGFAREGRGSLVAATDGGRLANPVILSAGAQDAEGPDR